MSRDAEGVEAAIKDAEEGDEGGDTHVHVHVNGTPETKDDEAEAQPSPDDKQVMVRIEAIESTLADLAEAVAQLANGAEEEEEEGEILGGDTGDGEGEILGEGEEEEEGRRGRTGDATLSSEARATFARAELLVPGIKFPVVDSKNPRKTRDALCKFRKSAMIKAYAHGEHGRDAINKVLGGKKVNLSKMTCDSIATLFNGAAEVAKHNGASPGGSPRANTGAVDINAINERNKAFWAKR